MYSSVVPFRPVYSGAKGAPMMMGVRRNSRFFVPMNTGTSLTPARMAIMPAPDLTSAWPGFFTRVPSGNRNRFHPSRRLCMAVLTAPMSL